MKAKSSTALLILALFSSCLPVWAEVPANAVWIDVRSPQEYAQGHLEGAKSIPYTDIAAGVAALNLAKDTPIYLYCAVGGRAQVAKLRLQTLDYTEVVNAGGLEDARKLVAD